MPMIPEVKEKWVSGLRDPDAKQGQDILRDAEGNQCCLDILNQMCSDAGYQDQPVQLEAGHWGYNDPEASPSVLEEGYQVTCLTTAAMIYAGLEDPDPEVNYKGGKYHLSYLNDMTGLNFLEIALVIEEDDEL